MMTQPVGRVGSVCVLDSRSPFATDFIERREEALADFDRPACCLAINGGAVDCGVEQPRQIGENGTLALPQHLALGQHTKKWTDSTISRVDPATLGKSDQALFDFNSETGEGQVWILFGNPLECVLELRWSRRDGREQAGLLSSFGRPFQVLEFDLPAARELQRLEDWRQPWNEGYDEESQRDQIDGEVRPQQMSPSEDDRCQRDRSAEPAKRSAPIVLRIVRHGRSFGCLTIRHQPRRRSIAPAPSAASDVRPSVHPTPSCHALVGPRGWIEE